MNYRPKNIGVEIILSLINLIKRTMKKVLLLLTIIIYSCSKDSPANEIIQQSASGSIQFKVNGSLVVMDNVDLASGQYAIFYKQLKGSILTETRYMLNAQKGANNVLAFPIITDSLHETNYHYDSASIAGTQNIVSFIMAYDGQNAGLFFKEDYFDVSISSYKNSRISGTFTAKFTPYSGSTPGAPGSIQISEGKINNVQVIY